MTWGLIATVIILGVLNFIISFFTLKKLTMKLKVMRQVMVVFLWGGALLTGNAFVIIIYLCLYAMKF